MGCTKTACNKEFETHFSVYLITKAETKESSFLHKLTFLFFTTSRAQATVNRC